MKLQAALLAIGLFVSVGAVGAEITRSSLASTVSASSSATTSAAQSSLRQSSSTSTTTVTLGAKPSISGGAQDD